MAETSVATSGGGVAPPRPPDVEERDKLFLPPTPPPPNPLVGLAAPPEPLRQLGNIIAGSRPTIGPLSAPFTLGDILDPLVTRQVSEGALGGPQYQVESARATGDTAALNSALLNVAAGAAGGLENRGAKYAGKILKDGTAAIVDEAGNVIEKAASYKAAVQRAASLAAERAPSAAANEALAAARGERVAPGTGGALKPGSSAADVAERKALANLSDEQVFAVSRLEGIDPAAKKIIDAEVAARSAKGLGITPETQIAAALRQVPTEVKDQVRRALRGEAGTLTPEAMYDHLTEALTKAKVPATAETRTALADALAEEQAIRNRYAAPAVARRGQKVSGVQSRPGVAEARQRLADQMGLDPVTGEPLPGITPTPIEAGLDAPISGTVEAAKAGLARAGAIPGSPQHGGIGSLALRALRMASGTKNIVLAGDPSPLLRQFHKVLFRDPKTWLRGAGAYVRSLRNPELAAQINQQVLDVAKQDAIDPRLLVGVKGDVLTGADEFADIAFAPFRKIPILGWVYGKTWGAWLARNEPAVVAMSNTIRVGLAKTRISQIEARYGRSLTKAERDAVVKTTGIWTGRGLVDLPQNELTSAASSLANLVATSPQNSAAMLRRPFIVLGSLKNIGLDLKAGRLPNALDVENVATAAIAVGADWLTLQLLAKATGGKVDGNSLSTSFGQVEVPQDSPILGLGVTVLDSLGIGTVSYNDKTYLDATGGDRSMLTLFARVIGQLPFVNKPAITATGKPKADQGVLSLLEDYFGNRLYGPSRTAWQLLQGKGGLIDWGDPTENPLSALFIQASIASGLQSVGLTNPGGPLRFGNTPDQLLRQRAVELRAQWFAAPAFSIGDPTEWAQVYRALKQYRALKGDKTVTEARADPNLRTFYNTAAGGRLRVYASDSGSIRSGVVSQQRQALQKDPAWKKTNITLDEIIQFYSQNQP